MTDSEVVQSMLRGIEVARNALDEVRKKIVEYDAHHINVKEKASTYLSATLDMLNTNLAELVHIAEGLKTGPGEIPVKAITGALARVNEAITQLGVVARQYDEKYTLSTRLSTVVAAPKEQAMAALALISAYAAAGAAAANAQLQGVADGLRANVSAEARIAQAGSAVNAVMEKLKELDGKLGVSGYINAAAAPAQQWDNKLTGGRVSQTIVSAYNLGWSMAGAVQDTIQGKKRKLDQEGSA